MKTKPNRPPIAPKRPLAIKTGVKAGTSFGFAID
jgi:hypothetical protein